MRLPRGFALASLGTAFLAAACGAKTRRRAVLPQGSTPSFVVVDDTKIPHPAWTECRTDNDVTVAQTGSCSKD